MREGRGRSVDGVRLGHVHARMDQLHRVYIIVVILIRHQVLVPLVLNVRVLQIVILHWSDGWSTTLARAWTDGPQRSQRLAEWIRLKTSGPRNET